MKNTQDTIDSHKDDQYQSITYAQTSRVSMTETKKEIKELVSARGPVKASLTRLKTFLDQFSDDQDILAVKLRMPRLQEIWSKYEDIQARLQLIDIGNIKHEQDRWDCETHY
jgi:hypothetical protein